jgi:hypothetical protein
VSIGADWGYSIAYSFLFAGVMFAIFTLSIILLDKLTKIEEFKKILLSICVSSIGGGYIMVNMVNTI